MAQQGWAHTPPRARRWAGPGEYGGPGGERCPRPGRFPRQREPFVGLDKTKFASRRIWKFAVARSEFCGAPLDFASAKTNNESNVYSQICSKNVPFVYLSRAKHAPNRTSFDAFQAVVKGCLARCGQCDRHSLRAWRRSGRLPQIDV